MAISYMKLKNINLRFQEIPNDDKETIIFLHFGTSTLAVWNGIIPYFEKDYHIIAPDLRCHGFSDKPSTGYHIDLMAKDILELLTKLKVTKTHIIGSSLGADVAVSLAANYPEKILSLVCDGAYYDLVGPASKEQILTPKAIIEEKNNLKRRILEHPLPEFTSKSDLINHYKTQWEKHNLWSDIFLKATEDDIYQDKNGKYRKCQSKEILWKFCEPLYDIRIENYIKRIKCPILFLPDEADSNNEIVQKTLKKFQNYLKFSKIVTIPGSIHAYTCMIKHLEFSNAIKDFYREIKDKKII